MQKTYYDITKDYPDMYRVMIYKTPYIPKPKDQKEKLKTLSKNIMEQINFEKSLARTRRTIYDYAQCNDFDLFVTFTFDPKKVNRYDMTHTYIKMQSWLWRHQKRQRELEDTFRYIIVPEKHKDGAIHFHALTDSKHFALKKTNVIQNNKRVFNIPSWRFGFTNAQFFDDDKQKVAAYITKYITKDMIVLPNKRRYWCSKNLKKPETYYNAIYDLGLSSQLNHNTTVSETDYNVIYQINKNMFEK